MISFGLGIVENFIFAVLNASDKKGAQLQMYSKEWKLKRTKRITNKPITAVAISQNGELLAVGTADFSVEIHTTEFKVSVDN